MAQREKRLPQNVEGEFYVDSTCIDCDACRQIAPATFRDHGGQSSCHRQPRDANELQRALMALVACPTASIGTVSNLSAREAVSAFPTPVANIPLVNNTYVVETTHAINSTHVVETTHVVNNVYFCGFTAESSFGAWSYLIVRPPERGGNVLVDSPRFAGPLVKRIEQMGGVSLMFLTHRDDIADHARFAAHFHCPRVMHQGDITAASGIARPSIERVISGEAEIRLDQDLLLIPTPGHTRGHQVLLYRGEVLFTGDHLAWSPERQTLTAFHDVCWYSWTEQTRSMEKLLGHGFAWVLPGHGRIHGASVDEMHQHLARCVAWMKTL